MKKYLMLFILLIGLITFTLAANKGAEFGGTDDKASQLIEQIHPGYKVWFQPVWEPPSSEIESLLFALQAAAGTGFICFYLGYAIGRNKEKVKS